MGGQGTGQGATQGATANWANTKEINCPANFDGCRSNSECQTWAKGGECSKNPLWMQAECSGVCCRVCGHDEDPATATSRGTARPSKGRRRRRRRRRTRRKL